ncbi:MAG: endonuclease III [Bacteroidales bacterium]
MRKEELFKRVIAYFEDAIPVAETELHYKNPYELIVAVILSAQCTDKRVNMITPEFFRKYPTLQELSKNKPEDVFAYIKSCSYPNNKARHLIGMARTVIREFNGVIPDNPQDLQKLPGVGRKTANVVLSVAFNQPAMAVDTHVFRVTARIGLTVHAKTPLETELQLVKYIPEALVHKAHHWFILHGRYVCLARNPRCSDCGLAELCKYNNSKVSRLKTSSVKK